MFVQSADLVAAHGGKRTDISVYGQEFVATTWRLAKMNLALRGIEANLADESADSFHRDKFPDLCKRSSKTTAWLIRLSTSTIGIQMLSGRMFAGDMGCHRLRTAILLG